MNREIKFRAWDTSGEWPYMLGPYKLSDAIFNHKDIRSLPLMQFTGLHDKNGKEIYEGDIVRALSERGFDHGVHKGELFSVVMFVQNGSWYVTRKYREDENMGSLKAMWELLANCDIEIIGNIHSNPELLQK
ncbi:MAG: hypothetical protein KAY48_01730 [Saprospiraceae bacterium]|jgi:uncharacterized phage protein (TIGR01671 family)|nr:hypothetical protein [Saprospiraceae bacterium]